MFIQKLRPLQLTSYFWRRIRPRSAAWLMAWWHVPGWSLAFDRTLGRTNRGVTISASIWLPLIKALEAEFGPIALQLSSTGILIAIGEEYVWSFPLSPRASKGLIDAHAVWAKLNASDSCGIRELVDYHFEFKDHNGKVYSQVTKLEVVAASDQEAALMRTLELLRGPITVGAAPQALVDAILNMLKDQERSWPTLRARSQELLSKDWALVRAHCDLTPGNLMSLKGSPRLIDLDQYRERMPAFFDPCHFVVEAHAKSSKRSWLEVVQEPDQVLQMQIKSIASRDAEGVSWREVLDIYILLRASIWLNLRGSEGEAARNSPRLQCLFQIMEDRLSNRDI